MESFEKFKQRRALEEKAENVKMVVVAILVLSVMVFTFIGEDAVKPIIWIWAGFMTLLLIGCAVQDYVISRKVKKL